MFTFFPAEPGHSIIARQKDILSTEELGILLQWHWKYGTSVFANERQRVQMGLLMLFSAFTGSRPAMLLTDNDSSCRDSLPSYLIPSF
jgi:hypothetical protein